MQPGTSAYLILLFQHNQVPRGFHISRLHQDKALSPVALIVALTFVVEVARLKLERRCDTILLSGERRVTSPWCSGVAQTDEEHERFSFRRSRQVREPKARDHGQN